MPRARSIPAAAFAACAMLCWSVAAPTLAAAQDLVKARLAQNLGPISGLVIVAKAKGMFEKQGLDISVANFTSGKQCLDTVIGGGADFATTAEAPVTAAAMASQPIAFVILWNIPISRPRRPGRHQDKADLRGKKISFTASTGGRSTPGC